MHRSRSPRLVRWLREDDLAALKIVSGPARHILRRTFGMGSGSVTLSTKCDSYAERAHQLRSRDEQRLRHIPLKASRLRPSDVEVPNLPISLGSADHRYHRPLDAGCSLSES